MDETRLTHRLTRFFKGKTARAEPSTPDKTQKEQLAPTIEKKAGDSTVSSNAKPEARRPILKSTATSQNQHQEKSRDLLSHCVTDKQREAIELVYVQGMGKVEAARHLGIHHKSLSERIEQVERRAGQVK